MPPPACRGRGTASLPQILPPPACRGRGEPRSQNLPPPARGGRGTTKWWKGEAAPSGRCLRSGHKNSVKGKGAIKHKGAPTIIYHCTDAPFRLAPLATHPLSGGGQETWRRGAINPKPCLPLLAGGGGPRSQKLASPRLQGGEGDHEVVEGAAPSGQCLRSGNKNSVKGKGAIKHKGAPTIIYHCTDAPFRLAPLATHPQVGVGKKKMDAPFRLAPLATHPLSVGGQGKDGFPLPSRFACHPPPKWGWARKTLMPLSISHCSPPIPEAGMGR